MTIYIMDWDKNFETAQSRKVSHLNWVSIPNNLGSRAYRKIMLQDNGIEIFGVWILLVQIASRAPIRGILADEDGAYSLEDLEVYSDCPKEKFATAIPILASIGWIFEEDNEQVPPRYQTDTTVLGDTVQDSTVPNLTEERYIHSGEKYDKRSLVVDGWNSVPDNRQRSWGKFQTAWIEKVLDDPSVDAEMVKDLFRKYYESEQGKSKYFRYPSTLLVDEFWRENPVIWGGNNEVKFSESPHDHERIIKRFIESDQNNLSWIQELQDQGKTEASIAYKIWLKHPEYQT